MIASLIAIFILLVLSALFSGSETTMTAVSRARMHRLEQQGSKGAAAVNQLLERPERLIGAILLGNNVVNIVATALATAILVDMFAEAGAAYAAMVMTVMVLIFAEVLPKSYAINHADRLALIVGPVMKPIVAALAPVVAAIQVVVRATLGIFGVSMSRTLTSSDSEEELRGAIDLHGSAEEPSEGGGDRQVEHERNMLRGILDLTDVEVSEIMTHRSEVETIDADQPPEQILAQVLNSRYTRLPMWKDDPDNVIGILHAKDVIRALRAHEAAAARNGDDANNGDDAPALDIASVAATPWFIPESTELLHQLQEFRRRREHIAMVVDEYGSLMGVVTLEDILEEIVGEIDDEHDPFVRGMRRQSDGSFIVNGTVTIRDINREYDWSLPDEDAATVAGLVLHEARRIPKPGQVFEFYGFRFEILRRQQNRLTLLRVTPPAAD